MAEAASRWPCGDAPRNAARRRACCATLARPAQLGVVAVVAFATCSAFALAFAGAPAPEASPPASVRVAALSVRL
jgi:hypothetical protein